jgi:two-component system chemotaxis response regulator CheV
MAKPKEGILLESGTDEVEILEFTIQGQGFGVNVMKIQAIEQYDAKRVTKLPTQNPAVAGMFLFRDHTIPMIDLGEELQVQSLPDSDAEQVDPEQQKRIVLVTQFNRMTNAFLVDGVRRIHRVNWADINPLSPMLSEHSSEFTGSVDIDGREILIVDMEKISGDYFPTEDLLDLREEHFEHPQQDKRPETKIFLVEDSSTTRNLITGVLGRGQYTNVEIFENGKDAHDEISRLKAKAAEEGKSITDYVSLVITDIEMPQMDGLTLCHHIKFALGLDDLPVILYSSLMKEQMTSKCEDCKADAYITKPQCGKLVHMVDRICLDKEKNVTL